MTLPQKIRRALRAHEPHTLSNPLTIASAIYQVHPSRTSHMSTLTLLPEFIDAELEHQSDLPKYRALKRHLLICPHCATLYFDLLETALLDAQRKLTIFPAPSRPNLNFLNFNDTGD